jgi:predicted RNase H-like HicB family nuclease
MPKELTVIFEPGDDGWWIATIPELPGAFCQGRTKTSLAKTFWMRSRSQ